MSSFTPPSDLNAEQSLLGSILLNPKTMDEVADKILFQHFYDPRHQKIFQYMASLSTQNKPIDILFLLDYAKSVGDDSITKDFLLELVSHSSLSKSPAQTCTIIKDKSILRSLIEIGDTLKKTAMEEGPTREILDNAQKSIFDISHENQEKNFIQLSEIIGESFDRINELHENPNPYRGTPTGFTDLDKKLGGLVDSNLIILAARPSMGKTSLALEIMRRVALSANVGVGMFSLEMSKEELTDKLLATTSGVDLWKIRNGLFSDKDNNNDFMKLGNAIGILDQAPIFIDDSGGLNILELRSKCRRLLSKHNIGLIIIDYLQLMSGRGNMYRGNRVQEVSDISRSIKMLAKELDVPIIALSQLSRGVESRDDKRPMLSDLRESGSIEQDADVVMFVHREERYHPETKKKGIADIIVAKHRGGEIGSVELKWIHNLATFGNLENARLRSYTGE